jgi:transposase
MALSVGGILGLQARLPTSG